MSGAERSQAEQPTPFTGQGTLLSLDIRRFQGLAEALSTEKLLELVEAHLEHTSSVIATHGGVVHRYVGDAVEAYWLDDRELAANSAVACAMELLESPIPKKLPRGIPKSLSFSLDVSLATGELVGAVFGPIQQLQIIGPARNNLVRVTSLFGLGNGLRLCPETFNRLRRTDLLCPIATVERDNLEPLTIHGLMAEVQPKRRARWPWS